MKKLFLISLCLTLSLSSFAQSHSFKINEYGHLRWEKVFGTNISQERVFSYLISLGYFKDIIITNNSFFGRFVDIPTTYKGMNVSWIKLNSDFKHSYLTGGVLVEMKEGKYKVTFQNMTLLRNIEVKSDRIYNNKIKLDLLFVDDNKINSKFVEESELLDINFIRIFTVPKDVDSEW
ncbi:hypothetical protein [Sphingobacterium bovistauri]|uniref:DUF4468 domain-containing protein n=1 Tax=Sphingobacterium bovistauri TaxID=2781959 RepID=A0ABS7Z0T8_9SPHI|nr:hypothetical protein [Sphingobacterium bovistauri]MCA5003780.1 hypothetical protein [Sphingobacterium bovistauri]